MTVVMVGGLGWGVSAGMVAGVEGSGGGLSAMHPSP